MAEDKLLIIQKELAKPVEEMSIIDLVGALIEYAYTSRASDVHIQPFEDEIKVRLRIDGILHDIFVLPKKIQSEIITRIKVLASLRTDEHQAAQDGRFRISLKKLEINFDVRVSIIPTYYGENTILRILAEQAQISNLKGLGFRPKDLIKLEKAIKKPYGMILATGPTGCGKTTTLYTILKSLNSRDVSIITIEDPIEYSLEGISQIQTNIKTGLTFADGLRSILRQDPNILMVGEIRDQETAGIAVNAALTGHLLLSTLHTNDAATALPRLIDLGTQPFLISSTVNIIIAQRLVRMICQDCRTEKNLTDTEAKSLSEMLPQATKGKLYKKFFVGKGCKKCLQSGYHGRVGIHEILEINDEIRSMIMGRANASEIKEAAIKMGMTTMIEDGFQKALKGTTTIEEILRVIHE
ncbi:MAG: ATPase, T2SS/T4P/T4SS family [Candidatus Paceibacterota bacterium]